jgi:phenylacetate-CoA ligase
MTVWKRHDNIEFRSCDEIRSVQNGLLREHLRYAAARSPYYGRQFRELGIDPDGITVENLGSIPLTDKARMAERHEDFLAVPMSRIVDIVLSSGTTGKSTAVMYTESDLQRLAYNEEISFASCGLTSDDAVLLTCTMDRCFIAGLAYFSGVRSLGAAAVRNGLSSVESHFDIIQLLKPTALVGVPTFLLRLGEYLVSQGVDPAGTGIRKLVCIGEPIRGRDLSLLRIGENLTALWGAGLYSTYASSETISSFCECTCQQGGHLHPDLAILEVVDEAGRTLPPGETGEVVVTPLAIEGMPLVRFRTGDMSFVIDEPCSCGRNSLRLGPILGRKQQMIKFRGTTIYPDSIYAVLDAIPSISGYYVTVSSDYDLSDLVTVAVALRNDSCPAGAIMEKLQSVLRVMPEVTVVSEDQVRSQHLSGSSRKINRFVDKRKSE